MYVKAIELYARLVASRALACYTVGSVPFPGLSDIDLLVVVRDARRDNAQFFSAIDRLPKIYRPLFLHNPFVLPATCVDVLRFTSHGKRTLESGTDVLVGIAPLASLEERWCKLFESYCNFAVYLAKCQTAPSGSARLAVAVASSMRYALSDLDAILGTDHAPPYARDIDERRGRFGGDLDRNASLALEAWTLLRDKFAWLEQTLGEMVPLRPAESLVAFADEFLRGNRTFGSLDTAAIARRRAAIDFYHDELHRLRFPYGHLFFFAAYHTAERRYYQSRPESMLLALLYRARKIASG